MTDYSKNVDYAAKDALAPGDSAKKILGSDVASEFDELVTVIATKYDSAAIASQAQAIAGVSNTTLMTPLRVQQALAGGTGLLADIAVLTDPNADRILFWDDSADAAAYLTVSTGLTISGVVLTTNDAAINHNALQNYVANQHIDHSSVSVSTAAQSGLTGGGDLTASRALSVNITGLTEDTVPQTSADYIMTWDTSASALKKVLGDNLVGAAVGDGRWYSAAGQAIAANLQTTVVYDTDASNNLQRGTFSTSTGLYTATNSAGARVLITCVIGATSLASSRSFSGFIIKNGSIIARESIVAIGGTWTTPAVTLSAVVSLAYNETVGVAAFFTTSANTLIAGEAYNQVSIVELG
jgi:hypothetical protein